MFDHLLSPLQVGNTIIKNRVLMGSMHTNLEEIEGGFDRLAVFYRERALGQVGLIITGGIAPNEAGCTSAKAAKLSTEDEVAHHQKITQAVHDAGGKICMQILHTGRYGYHPNIVAPTAIQAPINFFKPKELTYDEILQTIDDYVQCAHLAQKAGYDGVEIMGSEGYLINQFIVTRTNHRTDEWGGEYNNRIKFPLEIIRKTREKTGEDFLIIYRLSMLDLVEDGSTWEEVVQLAKEVQKAGASMINSGIGWHEARIPTIASMVPRKAFAWVTKKLKDEVDIPLIAVNRINSPEVAESVLADGCADMVSMARPFLADPHLVKKTIEGRANEINVCIACNQACLDHTFQLKISSCLVNPQACHEDELVYLPAQNIKKIAVVGAGPAGLAFSHIAAMRGHQVTLYEASDRLGGQFNLAKQVPGKEDYAETIRYYEQMMIKYGVNVHKNELATAEMLANVGYDEIILANGIIPRKLDIPGCDHAMVVNYADVLDRKVCPGQKVAVIGAGGIGFDVATFLTESKGLSENVEDFDATWGIDVSYQHRGGIQHPNRMREDREVYLLKRSGGKHGSTLGKTTGWIHKAILSHHGVKMLSDVNYEKVDDQGLHISIKGENIVLPVDQVIVCAGQNPSRVLYDALLAMGINSKLIGGADDAVELDAKRAIHQACHLAASI
jgi:2,4-dienoyl-CoA reductase (NADPH2)